jgi:hypothetical protein
MTHLFRLAAATVAVLLYASSVEARTRHTYNYQYHESVHQRQYQHYDQQQYRRHYYQDYYQQSKKVARHHKKVSRKFVSRRHKEVADANGNEAPGIVVSQKTGAKARVGAKYAAQFQAYIDDLEAAGATVLDMGGYRKGRCSSGHQHPCGKALDVCQLKRDRVDSRCHLPGRAIMARLARKNGLFEGGQWCDGDVGHVQISESAPNCGNKRFAERREAKEEAAVYSIAEGGPDLTSETESARSKITRHHRHHRRYASR